MDTWSCIWCWKSGVVLFCWRLSNKAHVSSSVVYNRRHFQWILFENSGKITSTLNSSSFVGFEMWGIHTECNFKSPKFIDDVPYRTFTEINGLWKLLQWLLTFGFRRLIQQWYWHWSTLVNLCCNSLNFTNQDFIVTQLHVQYSLYNLSVISNPSPCTNVSCKRTCQTFNLSKRLTHQFIIFDSPQNDELSRVLYSRPHLLESHRGKILWVL